MTSARISIVEEAGEYVSSRRDARVLRERVAGLVDTGDASVVELDFDGVKSISRSFSDGLIAVLVAERGAVWFKSHVAVLNLSDEDRAEVLDVISKRLQREAPIVQPPADGVVLGGVVVHKADGKIVSAGTIAAAGPALALLVRGAVVFADAGRSTPRRIPAKRASKSQSR